MFFVLDRIKYKRLWLRYIADIYDLRTNHPNILRELEAGNISVTKKEIAFVSIGADHVCEHLNKLMKVRAGLIGISNNANARHSFFMAAPELSCQSKEFKRYVLVWQHEKQCGNPRQDCMGSDRRRSVAAGSSEARLLQGHNWSSQASNYWCAPSPIRPSARCWDASDDDEWEY